ncbi:hypothetical protein [Croceimicrobium hydrocarbonivorans]|uniref:Uncharacterized protein n=1 Tax=Croceimicrobium hydrocarbonivorans TaxID=2761580 RepID=A0A7H0VDX2_9FLAO|nr:hypothetical protein [Croceimicrobium hydrocarbonivorans]QNR23920.1 hypothetical protein H4K34_16310 [Croceimicrobium hydrocarbonivorans]
MTLIETPYQPEEWNLTKSIERLDHIVSESSGSQIANGIRLLLKNEDWRPHLVAALAILKIDKDLQFELKSNLWSRLKSGSWVSPQILVILSLIDSEFNLKAKEICENGFEISYSEMPMHEHHFARGPAGLRVDNKKVVASVEYLLNGVIIDSRENDNGGSLAKGWKENLFKLIDNKRFKIKK